MGMPVMLQEENVHDYTSVGVLKSIVESNEFKRETRHRDGLLVKDVQMVYISGWTVLGSYYSPQIGGYKVELVINVFSVALSNHKVIKVTIPIHPPAYWRQEEVSDRVYGFLREMHKCGCDVRVGGYHVVFGEGKAVDVIDYSVKEHMVSKLLYDEEKFEIIEDRILFNSRVLNGYKKRAWDVEKVNGYYVYRFQLRSGKYLGITCGGAWIGRSGDGAGKMKMIYDLTKMGMSEARQEVKKAYQHKYISDMMLWFIDFADMRKKMPTQQLVYLSDHME
ncbi:hypothetical protein ACTFR8_22920 [Bacillus cereus group sp. MYBK15-3]|uniref:hypothetical protein n=1 Tax=unclassified Bacillus cereus group TaxID=2750818 RepID=UPI003F7927C1